MPIDIAITGAAGRMGTRLVALAHQSGDFRIVAALERPGHPALGRDAGELAAVGPIGVPLSAELATNSRLLIDFTLPEPMRHWLDVCTQRRIAMLIGTTGLTPDDHRRIDAAAKTTPVLQAPNMSLGVAVLFKVAAEMGKLLGSEYDIEIVEAHHRFKKDAPSGTAVGLRDAIQAATGRAEIPTHALRMGDEVGRHTAYFAALGERLEITHRATNRDTFVHGALKAALWLAQQKPGRYGINDVLGI